MKLKLIVTVTRTDLAGRIIERVKTEGATGATVIPARGTGIHEAKTFFGLSMETQRDVILFLVRENMVEKILDAIQVSGSFEKPGTGIAFAIDVEQAVGLESQGIGG